MRAAIPLLVNPQWSRPNIIFILADDLGYGELGCYGQKKIRTPHLDQLAAEGMRFTQCYAGGPDDASSRSALLTGFERASARRRLAENGGLRPEDFTVAEALQSCGYRTCALGKWALAAPNSGSIPTRQGFDEWLGFLQAGRATELYPTFVWRNGDILPLPQNEGNRTGLSAQNLFTLAATNFVRTSRLRPFFLYLAYATPDHITQASPPAGSGSAAQDDAPYADEAWPGSAKKRAAAITLLDRQVGGLMAELKRLQLDDRTVIFFSSDGGPSTNGLPTTFLRSSGGLRGGSGDLTEGGLRVPLIVRWPGRITPGQLTDHVCALWDFLPTVCDVAEITPPPGLNGYSLLPVLEGRPQTNAAPCLYWTTSGNQEAVRMENWKAIRTSPELPWALYDLKNDPGEAHDVAALNPGILTRVHDCLKKLRQRSSADPAERQEQSATAAGPNFSAPEK